MEIKVKKISNEAILPRRASDGAAGYDLYTPRDFLVHVGRNLIQLDLAFDIPKGYHIKIVPRSGFDLKGFEGANGNRFNADVKSGTVDDDYTGNVGVIVKSDCEFLVAGGTRIAQAILYQTTPMEFKEVDELKTTERGAGGFGSTGVK